MSFSRKKMCVVLKINFRLTTNVSNDYRVKYFCWCIRLFFRSSLNWLYSRTRKHHFRFRLTKKFKPEIRKIGFSVVSWNFLVSAKKSCVIASVNAIKLQPPKALRPNLCWGSESSRQRPLQYPVKSNADSRRCESRFCRFSWDGTPWTASRHKLRSKTWWRRRKYKASKSVGGKTFRRFQEREWRLGRRRQRSNRARTDISTAKNILCWLVFLTPVWMFYDLLLIFQSTPWEWR